MTHLPIERQARVIGAAWLDQQLIGGGKELSQLGFGSAAKEVLQKRADFLADQGLTERRGQRIMLTRNLPATLRNRELSHAAETLPLKPGWSIGPSPMGSAQLASTGGA